MFTVVIPVLGKAATIEATLRSVLAQRFDDFEAIVVGPPDDPAMVLAAGIADTRVRLLPRPAEVQGAARNAGIDEGRADWIAFLDGDDLWLPDHLAQLDEIRTSHPYAGLIGTAYVDTDANGRFDLPSPTPPSVGPVCLIDEIGAGRKPLCTSSAAIPRRTYATFGGFLDARHGEDSEYWLRIALREPVIVSRRASAVYVHGTGGVSEQRRWTGSRFSSASDLSPPVALLLGLPSEQQSPSLRRSIQKYVDRYFDWCLRELIASEDIGAIRSLRRVYRGRPPVHLAAMFSLSFLPDRLARSIIGTLRAVVRRRKPARTNAISGRSPRQRCSGPPSPNRCSSDRLAR